MRLISLTYSIFFPGISKNLVPKLFFAGMEVALFVPKMVMKLNKDRTSVPTFLAKPFGNA